MYGDTDMYREQVAFLIVLLESISWCCDKYRGGGERQQREQRQQRRQQDRENAIAAAVR